MRLRNRPLPRTISDSATTLFLAVTVPLTYWFELWILLPEIISTQSAFYCFNFSLGTFVMVGILSNMLAIMMCNTSIVGRKISRPPKANAALWKYCAACESPSPPRAWHCTTCRVCVLKRDHHCMFTGDTDTASALFIFQTERLLLSEFNLKNVYIELAYRLLHRTL